MKRMEMDGWVGVWQTGIDYEADLVRDRLDDAGVEAVIMRKKDRSFPVTQGSMSPIHVMVPSAREAEARAILASLPPSDEELTAAALAADPEHAPAPGEAAAGDGQGYPKADGSSDSHRENRDQDA
jgi:hypothetical protein